MDEPLTEIRLLVTAKDRKAIMTAIEWCLSDPFFGGPPEVEEDDVKEARDGMALAEVSRGFLREFEGVMINPKHICPDDAWNYPLTTEQASQ
jgi:hypothetical protein